MKASVRDLLTSDTRVLVTNLQNRVQPIIRLEVSDSVVLDPESCPCGRTLVRTRAIEGRADDVLELPGQRNGAVAVHPLQFAMITRDREVREFQVIQRGGSLRILVVPRPGAGTELESRLGWHGHRKACGAGGRATRGVGRAARRAAALTGRQASGRGRRALGLTVPGRPRSDQVPAPTL